MNKKQQKAYQEMVKNLFMKKLTIGPYWLMRTGDLYQLKDILHLFVTMQKSAWNLTDTLKSPLLNGMTLSSKLQVILNHLAGAHKRDMAIYNVGIVKQRL